MSYNDTTDYDAYYLLSDLRKDAPDIAARVDASWVNQDFCRHNPLFNKLRSLDSDQRIPGCSRYEQMRKALAAWDRGEEFVGLVEHRYPHTLEQEKRWRESERIREESIRLFKAVYSKRPDLP